MRFQTTFKTDGITRYNTVLPKNDTNDIDDFIDHLVDGSETNPGEGSSITPAAKLKLELESRSLSPIDFVQYDRVPTKWPAFIQSFKTRVHMKHSFTDSICIERLTNVLDGEL